MLQNKVLFYGIVITIIVIGMLAIVIFSSNTLMSEGPFNLALVSYYGIWIIAILCTGFLHRGIRQDHVWRNVLFWCIIFCVLFVGYTAYQKYNDAGTESENPVQYIDHDPTSSNVTI